MLEADGIKKTRRLGIRLLAHIAVISLAVAALAPVQARNAAPRTAAARRQLRPGDIRSVQLTLIGRHNLASRGLDGQVKPRGQNGDVAIIGKTAFVAGGALFHGARNTPGRVCTDYGGVKVVDLRRPSKPVLRTTIPIEDNTGVGAPWPTTNPRFGRRLDNVSDSVSSLDAVAMNTPTFRGNVLAIATQRCEPSFFFGARIEFWDVTRPATPRRLGIFDPETIPNPNPQPGAPPNGRWGIFEDVRMFRRGDKFFAVTTTPFSIGNAQGANASPFGDFRLLDITDIRNPRQIGTFPPVPIGETSLNGCRQFLAGRSAAPTPNRRHAILSFWDGSEIMLPSERREALFRLDLDNLPRLVPSTEGPPRFNPTPPAWGYPQQEAAEGNAADAEPFTGPGGRLLVALSEEDIDPAITNLSIDAPAPAAGSFRACETPINNKLYRLPRQQLSGPVAYVGRGCPESRLTGTSNRVPDDYLEDPRGKIALIDLGGNLWDGCSTAEKVHRAIAAGATGVMLNAGVDVFSSPNLGPAGGIPSRPWVTIPLSAYRRMQYLPTTVLAAPTTAAPDPFPTTWERTTATNVRVVAAPAQTRVDFGRFQSVANDADRVARGQINAANRFDVVGGQQYVAGGFMEVASHVAGAFRSAVVWYDGGGNVVGDSEIARLTGVAPRQRHEQVVTAPAGAAKAALKFEWTGANAEGTGLAHGFEFVPSGLRVTLKDSRGEWGAQRIIDFSRNPPASIATYRSPTARRWPPPNHGIYSPQFARLFGRRLLFSTWMSDGLRVLDVSRPAAPREVGRYVPRATADPAPSAGAGSTETPPLTNTSNRELRRGQVWPNVPLVMGVDALQIGRSSGIVAISDINGGLYVLRYNIRLQPRRAPRRRS